MLRLNTLGGLVALRDGAPLTGEVAQPRRLALLAALARAGTRGITRDKVLALLWPDTDEERARRTLSQALYALRRGLGDDAAIVGTNDLRLDAAVITSDVDEFEAAIREGALERAVELYGGPFLDGFRLAGAPDFDRWLETERNALSHAYASTLEQLARDAANKGDALRAVQWWRKRAGLDPTNSRVAMELMRALAAAGDRPGALNHARMFAVLVEQDELPPDENVARLAAELRDAPVPAAPSPPIATPTPIAPSLPAPAAADATAVAPRRVDAPLRAGSAGASRSRVRWTVAGVATLALAAAAAFALRWGPRSGESDAIPTLMVGEIADYTQATDQPSLTRALGDMLATNLARVPRLRVVSAARAQELLRGAGSERDTSMGVLSSVARQAGARELVDGALYKLGDSRYRLDLRRTDLTTGSVLSALAVEGSDAFALVDSGTARLVAAFGVTAPTGSIADFTTRSVVAYRLYVDGVRAFFRGQTRTAHDLFNAALGEDSTFALAAYYSALTETPPDRVGPALARIVHLADRASDRERLIIRGAWADAVSSPTLGAIADTLATRYPAEVQGPLYRGVALLRAGDFLAAIPHFQRAFAMDSVSLALSEGRCGACSALNGMIEAYMLADSIDGAMRIAQRWTRLQPTSAIPWFVLSGSYEVLGRTDDAVAAYRAGLALDPTVPVDPIRIPVLNIAGFRFDEADRTLRGLLDTPQTQRNAAWFLALSLRMQGRLQEAMTYAERYRRLSMESDIPGVRSVAFGFGQAQMLFEAGRYRESAALFDSIARVPLAWSEPSRAARQRVWNFTHAANARAELRDTTALRVYIDTVRLEGPRSLYGRDGRLYHHIEGLLARVRGDDETAARAFREAIYSPGLGYTRSNLELGRALVRLGRGADAVPVLQSATRSYLDGATLYANHTEIREALGDAWTAAGRPDSAAAHYRIVASAWAAGDPPFRTRAARADSLVKRITR